jgi:hypothetical protein
MFRIVFTATILTAATLSAGPSAAQGNTRSDVERNGIIQQSIYDFHRQNAERRPVPGVQRPVAQRRR